MRVATILIWLPAADGDNANVFSYRISMLSKMTFECVHKLYYFMISTENCLIVKCNMYF